MSRVCPAAPRGAVLVVTFIALVAAAGVRVPAAESPQITSTWRERDVRVDGVDEEWRDLLMPVKGQHFSVGVMNDGDALYFCLVAKDQMTAQQISRMGLVVWLDHAGGKKRTFGVRFPVGYGPTPMGRRQRPPAEAPSQGGSAAQAEIGQRDIEILGPGKNDVREIENGRSGVQARFTVRDDLIVYELKVPLRKSEDVPFAPEVDPGAAMRLELQTPEWRGPLPMRRGPMIGIGGGHGGIFYPPANTAFLKPMDIAAELRLATAPKGDERPRE